MNQALVEIGFDDSANLEQLGDARLVCVHIECTKSIVCVLYSSNDYIVEEEVVNFSLDMFDTTGSDVSVNAEPYHISQSGAGVATQTALALSISEVCFP